MEEIKRFQRWLASLWVSAAFVSINRPPSWVTKNTNVKTGFHSAQNVARSTFSERFLLNYKQSSGTNLISCGWLHTFQKKALAKNRSRDILHWMEIRLYATNMLGSRYTRKNLTTSNKSANKPSTSCVRTACSKLSTSLEQVVNNL